MAQDKAEKVIPIPNGYKFLFGGTAGMMATCFVQPLDLLKNRMQMSGAGGKAKEYNSSVQALISIIQKEGVFTLYNGLSAGLLRQATYTTTRLGIYTWLFDLFTFDGKPPNFAIKASIGMIAGVCGAFVGTPAEVALIRMTSDGRLPPDKRRNYKSVIDALLRIWKEEGITTWWKGAVPTMGRALVVNAAQLATYSQTKQWLIGTGHFQEGIICHFFASMIAGLITTAASLPVDIIKTRIQNAKAAAGQKQPALFDVLTVIIKDEGILALWKGFMPYYFRLGPHTVLTFIFLEQFNSAYRRLHRHDNN
ncbi:mitochondrial 2-oxoglutarate/malate carrier protein-like [Anthonomus grandis grandis]|uniref:mitochondrial 2-oxoglutarate/malate carrier protein-like n=1 Tax=Anthonomus grandis grandis TaxID=2921223 RepID=UPI00216528C8|nr:mitochondrial 2-oxoglutarate/malate carrier protein-like [Anthonomus grandis grandis]